MAKPTSRRRSAGEGTVFRRKDRPGWRGRMTWTEPDGTVHNRLVSGATQAEARARLDDLRARLRIGTIGVTGSATVGDYLTGWIERHRTKVRPSTWRTAEGYVRTFLIPTLGRIQLSKLTATDVEAALASFIRVGRPVTSSTGPKPRPVAPVTVNHVRAVLRRALTDARKAGLVGINAAADAKPPRVPSRSITYLTPAELQQLLTATADDPLGPMWALAASTGLRRGELVGLRWTDVDLSVGTLRVVRSVARDDAGGWSAADTKSARSRRTLPMPAMAKNALDRQRKRQARAKLAAGTAWQDREGYVFTDAVGHPLLPENVSHQFAKARAATRADTG